MKINDFQYMWRGKKIAPLSSQQTYWLDPIHKRGPNQERALLLLHGFASSPAVYRELLPALTLYDAVVCPVLPGHCISIAAFSKVSAGDWIAAAERACQALLNDYQTVDVLGLSLGGLLACHLSQRFTLNHLYLLAPALSLQQNTNIMLGAARILRYLGFKSLPNHAGNIHTNHFQELTYSRLPIATIIEILTLIKHFKFTPPSCPVDLFLGRFDEVVDSVVVADRFANQPNTQIHWLNHSAHVLPLDGDIKTILEVIARRFLHE